MPLAPGTRLGPYEVVAPLGAGGMGEVYRARDTRLGREVAIKVLPQRLTASPEDRVRFRREAKTISSLNHPHICVLHDVGQEGDIDYLVLELVDGETLAQRIARGPIPIAEGLRLGAQIAGALDRAHRVGVIHRDLKPGNVMLTTNGAKLMDFGLARKEGRASQARSSDATVTFPGQAPESDAPITARGTIVGTYQYMAPEQLEGKNADARSDIWALGCVLYEMATGKRAFEGATQARVISAIMRDQPREMAELAPLTPPTLERAVRRCLAKDPDERWQSAGDLQRELLWVAETGITAPRPHDTAEAPINALPPPTPRAGSWRRHHRVSFALGILLAVAVAGGILVRNRSDSQSQEQAGAAAVTKSLVLVADFDGPRSDPQLPAAARQLVVAAIDQSDRFECVSREGMKVALEAAGKPDFSVVDGALARELAFRNGIKVTIEGRVDRVGTALPIVLAARDAEDGHVLQSVSGSAPGEEALIPTIGRLTQQLRKKLGERPEALTLSAPRWVAATPSFDAYRKYAEAFDLQQMQGDDRGSLQLLREALRIDPDFAEAWAMKFFAHGHLGESDSAFVSLKEALSHQDRLSDDGRLYLQGLWEWNIVGDLEGAGAKFQELIRRGYQLSRSLGNHGMILADAGRYEEGLEELRRAAQAPFGRMQFILRAEVGLLLMFGDVREARDEARGLRGWYAEYWNLALAVSAEDWARVDSLAETFEQDPTRSESVRHLALIVRAARSAAKGATQDARQLLIRAQRQAKESNRPDHVRECRMRLLLLDFATGLQGERPPITVNGNLSPDGIAVRGLISAQRGDLKLAKQDLTAAGPQSGSFSIGAGDARAVLHAYLMGREGTWGEAARILEPWARLGERPRLALSPILVRWLTAQAYERSHQPDSAAAYYELALDPTRLEWHRRLDVMIVSTFAHDRLASLRASAGRRAEARYAEREAAADGEAAITCRSGAPAISACRRRGSCRQQLPRISPIAPSPNRAILNHLRGRHSQVAKATVCKVL